MFSREGLFHLRLEVHCFLVFLMPAFVVGIEPAATVVLLPGFLALALVLITLIHHGHVLVGCHDHVN